jgi:hypothetical protein
MTPYGFLLSPIRLPISSWSICSLFCARCTRLHIEHERFKIMIHVLCIWTNRRGLSPQPLTGCLHNWRRKIWIGVSFPLEKSGKKNKVTTSSLRFEQIKPWLLMSPLKLNNFLSNTQRGHLWRKHDPNVLKWAGYTGVGLQSKVHIFYNSTIFKGASRCQRSDTLFCVSIV